MAAMQLSRLFGQLPDHAFGAIAWTIAWTICYRLGRSTAPAQLSEADKSYWASSVTSTVHGAVITYLGWVACVDADLFTTRNMYATSTATTASMHCFLGYIIEDSVVLVKRRKEWKGSTPYLYHHFAAAFSWVVCLRHGVCHFMCCPLLLCEATAPLTNARWFFSKLGGRWRHGPIYIVNGLLMYFSFLGLRVIGMGWLGYRFLVDLQLEALALPRWIFCVILFFWAVGWALQLYWFKSMTTGMLSVLGLYDAKKGKQAEPSRESEQAGEAKTDEKGAKKRR